MGTLAGVTINIEQDTGWQPGPRLALLDPLDATETTIHTLGVPSNRRTIVATIKESPASWESQVAVCEAHNAVTFVGDVDTATVIILSINGQRIQNVSGATASDKFTIRFSVEMMETS